MFLRRDSVLTLPALSTSSVPGNPPHRKGTGWVHSDNSLMYSQRELVGLVRTECRKGRAVAGQFWGERAYPTMSIKTNSVIANSGEMSESNVAENRQHSGMNREKKRGPHKMPVSPIMCMKTRHRKKGAGQSPTMFMKSQAVTRRIPVCGR